MVKGNKTISLDVNLLVEIGKFIDKENLKESEAFERLLWKGLELENNRGGKHEK